MQLEEGRGKEEEGRVERMGGDIQRRRDPYVRKLLFLPFPFSPAHLPYMKEPFSSSRVGAVANMQNK